MLAAIDFSALALTGSAGFALCLSLALTLIVSMLGIVTVREHHMNKLSYEPCVMGEYRVARDGRAYVQVGRVCHFGRRGEDEGSLRARLASRGVL